MKQLNKTILLILLAMFLFSCSKKIDQSSMFHGREHKSKKKGIYSAGLNHKKPVSVQIKEEYDKQSKYDTNPKKAAKKAEKELEKKKKYANKQRAKNNKKRRVKVKTTKGKSSGDN